MTEEEIEELLEKLKQCDDFHNRCDFLMEHSEITYMLDYITKLQEENQSLKKENKILREKHNINDIGLLDENYKLQKVIDKAIEYIESNDIEVLKYHDIPSETTSYEIVTIDLLKILKGGENE